MNKTKLEDSEEDESCSEIKEKCIQHSEEQDKDKAEETDTPDEDFRTKFKKNIQKYLSYYVVSSAYFVI